MSGEWDELWTGSSYGRTWWDHDATPEQQQWCEKLADLIVKKGTEPANWKGGVYPKFQADTAPPHPSETTLRHTVRKLVEARG